MTERRPVYAEIPGCELFPISKKAADLALGQISLDPFDTGREDIIAVRANPELFKLELLSSIGYGPGIMLDLYREGIGRAHRILLTQAEQVGFQIPIFNHARATGVAHQIIGSNIELIRNVRLDNLEDVFDRLCDGLYEHNEAFVDGVVELTKYSYYGDSVGIAAIDTFKFTHQYLERKPVRAWWQDLSANN